ncbi:hypothetical protein IRZ71_19385 [Flavobacterium sp. ANB]|uniref:hypothetical protein n=1 Tax=unclassified Flavobacterium TaxID=196869 RepID=UPI0012B9DCBE|nr:MULTISPECIES: hypothetical protein [unclassified Flavobacterium]MBF4518526.1 hypothetical protein [Flavobacterium sp. ANB]MTD67968.1 hypothetical protein [Flavobacterium sp. LC2016-13]
MNKIVLFFLITFLTISCNSDDHDIGGFDYDASINISVSNSNADDLLNPKNPNAYAQNKIKILYLVDGKLIQKPNGTDYPNNFLVYEQDGHNVIRVFLNDEGQEKYPETYIQWDENHTDIIKVEYNRSSNSVTKKTVWLNDQIKTEIEPYLKIVK